MKFTDEHLNSLLDGELEPQDEAELRAALANDKALAARYADLAMVNLKFKDEWVKIDDKPIPQDILNLLSTTPSMAQNNRPESSSRSWRDWLADATSLPQSGWAPLAATVSALVIGLLFVNPFNNNSSPPHLTDYRDAINYGVMDPNHPVAQILSNTPSGSPQTLQEYGDLTVTPVLSFASTTGDFCREYTVTKSASSHRVLACHQDSTWRVVLSMETNGLAEQNEYQTAAAITPSGFENKVNSLLRDAPLSYQQEVLLIENNWVKRRF